MLRNSVMIIHDGTITFDDELGSSLFAHLQASPPYQTYFGNLAKILRQKELNRKPSILILIPK